MRISSERGQSIIEFALVLPIILLLILGTVDFGMLFLTKSQVEAASEAGARVAALAGTSQEITTAVHDILPAATWQSDPTDLTQREVGRPVSVTVSTTYTFLTPIRMFFPSSSITLKSDTYMVVEET